MNEIEAAIGLEQLEKLDDIIEKRRRNLDFLNNRLKQFEEYFYLFRDNRGEKVSPLAYPILIREKVKFQRRDLVNFLEANGIETRPMFSSIPTQQPAYGYLGLKKGRFPQAEYVGEHGFYIGIHQDLKEDDLYFVVDVIKEFIKKKG
jgi:dTDP-4-amino-4,6-dideoxygalactose transaminase